MGEREWKNGKWKWKKVEKCKNAQPRRSPLHTLLNLRQPGVVSVPLKLRHFGPKGRRVNSMGSAPTARLLSQDRIISLTTVSGTTWTKEGEVAVTQLHIPSSTQADREWP